MRAAWSKRMREWCERTSERTSEWPIINNSISRSSVSLCISSLEAGGKEKKKSSEREEISHERES